jgi:D-apionolactonase
VSRPTVQEMLHGIDQPAPVPLDLTVGPVSMALDGGNLRRVSIGGVEVVRRLYVAVRDQSWNTLPAAMSSPVVDVADDHVRVRFDCRNVLGEVAFSWAGEIDADTRGLTYTMRGRAESDFSYARIGLNILLPSGFGGCNYRAQTPDGAFDSRLPELVGPQPFIDGVYYPLCPEFTRLAVTIASGAVVTYELEGDLFGIEDQRNWSDDSFKTYSASPSSGLLRAVTGQEVTQHVRITAADSGAAVRAGARRETVRLTVGAPLKSALPEIGLGGRVQGPALSRRERERLAVLGPAHLRVDVHLDSADTLQDLETASELATGIGCGLEVAAFLGDAVVAQLTRLKATCCGIADIRRILIFDEGAMVTSAGSMELARNVLDGVAPLYGGSNTYFAEVNRDRPDPDAASGIVFSINPQVHTFDDLSLMEAPVAQGDIVRTAQSFSGGRPIAVTPVTLRPRFNPDAVESEPPPAPGELPFAVDPRQASLLCAAWTMASAKYLAEAGATSITYYEAAGWQGVMEREAGSPAPARFRSIPGAVFPVYHVLRDLSGWCRGEGLHVSSDDPAKTSALAFVLDGTVRMEVANLTPVARRVQLAGLRADTALIRVLDETTALQAMTDPEVFRAREDRIPLLAGTIPLELRPYAVVTVVLPG